MNSSIPMKMLHLRSSPFLGSPEKLIHLQIKKMPIQVESQVFILLDGSNIDFTDSLKAMGIPVKGVDSGWRNFPKVWGQLRGLIKDNKINLLVTHDYKSNFIGWLVCFRSEVRQVAIYHGRTSHDFKARFYEKIDKFILRFMDRVVVVSHASGNDLHVPKDKIEVIHNSFESSERQSSPAVNIRESFHLSKQAVVILHAGRFSAEKRQDRLIESFAMIHHKFPNAALILAGDGPERGGLEALVHKFNLQNRIFFAGFISDMKPYYQQSDIFALTSDREGLPLVLLEAAVSKLPVVSTDVGGVTEFLKDKVNGLVVKDATPSSLAKAFETLLLDPSLRKKMGEAGYLEWEKHFHPDEYGRKYFSLYQRVLQPQSVFMSWESHRRTRGISAALGCQLVEILSSAPRWMGHPWRMLKTWFYFLLLRPSIVFVQCPSIFLAGAALLYKKITGSLLVVDAHNEAVVPFGPGGKWYRGFVKKLHEEADWVIVTNTPLADEVRKNHGRPLILPDRIPEFLSVAQFQPSEKKNAVFICTFSPDEPYGNLIKAAKLMGTDFQMFITGNFQKADQNILNQAPSNVRFTGFLSEKDYLRTLQQANLVIDLTEMDNCLVCGAYEAVSLGRPLLTSDTTALRRHFRKGTIYSKHSPEELADSIKSAIQDEKKLEIEMVDLKRELSLEWETSLKDLRKEIFGEAR